MRAGMSVSCKLALAVALWIAPAALAQSEQLRKAVDLFDKQQWVEADEALRQVDVSKLNDDEKKEFDQTVQRVADALAGVQKANADMNAGRQAFDAAQWDEADRFYREVTANQYASPALKDQANQQLASIAEKRKPAEPPPAPVPAPAPAPEPPIIEAPAPAPATEQPAPVSIMPADEEPGRLTPAAQRRRHDELLWQRAVTRSQELQAAAREAVTTRDFTTAHERADESLQVVEAARNYAEPVSRYQAAHDAAVETQRQVAEQERVYRESEAAREQEEIARRVHEREVRIEQQKQEKIQQLFTTAAQLRKEQRFREAVEVLKQILLIDPSNARAKYELEVAEDYESLYRQKEQQFDFYNQTRKSLVSAEEALIPWDYEVLYPKNFLELTRGRTPLGPGANMSPEDAELNRKLDDKVPEVNFHEQPLEDVVDFISKTGDMNITTDWNDLATFGIERDKPISLTLEHGGVKWRTVLENVLSYAGGDVKLAYSVADGIIRIATKEKLDHNKYALVYDIRDLLVKIPNVGARSSLDPTQALRTDGGLNAGGSNYNGSLFTGRQDEPDGNTDIYHNSEVSTQIMDLLRQQVEPNSWRETGGGDGSMRELNGQLIVYNTSDAHRQVTDLLSQLRETRALQIAVESRFLSVTSNFLEEFGVDLDFVFNQGSAGFDRVFDANGAPVFDSFTGSPVLLPRQYSRIGATPAPPGFGQPLQGQNFGQPYGQPGAVPRADGGLSPHWGDGTPITAQQGSLNLVDPSQINTQVPGSWAQRSSLAPALNIAGSFLDNLQVDFLIRATQANARSSIVQAPRLVLFNGQRSRINIGRTRQYVSSVQPRVAEGAVGVQPIINNAQSGTELIVEGTISADRRYVTLTINTAQADEPNFERFEVQRASGSSPGIFVMLLDQTFAQVQTTVSIPDGGTVLLGGLKQVGEVELEAGIPVLSKIPVIKRAFTNTSTVKDTRTLLILVKAKIIIQKEIEEEAFPTFSSATPG